MRRYAIWGFAVLWAALYLMSVLIPMMQSPTDMGFTRGMNRVLTFLELQMAASLPALGLWIATRHLPPGPRWLARVPGLLAIALILGIAAVILWANMGRPPA